MGDRSCLPPHGCVAPHGTVNAHLLSPCVPSSLHLRSIAVCARRVCQCARSYKLSRGRTFLLGSWHSQLPHVASAKLNRCCWRFVVAPIDTTVYAVNVMSLCCSPTLISYNTLLQSYGKMGAYEHSLGVLQQMCTRCGNHTQSAQCAKHPITRPCSTAGFQ
jgi:pentatricopeptide repeat protein